jgi:hypothetical protein
MSISDYSELFAQGFNNTEIAEIARQRGETTGVELLRKQVGFLRRILRDNSPDALVLTKTVTNGEGKVITETHSRRSTQDETIPDHLQIDALTTSPSGGQWRKYKSKNDSGEILREELIKEVQPLNITYTNEIKAGDCALEIMLTDHHFGKIPFSYKTEDWTLGTAKAEYLKAIEYHLSKCPDNVGTLILPIGNDLLHINSNTGTTKRGTPMEYRENYHRLYSFVRDVIAGSVVSLSKRFNVEVVIVPGNHDEDACYRLGDYLEGLFNDSDRVKVRNSGHDRKYTLFGNSLILHTHGEKVKPEKLHDAFSIDVPELNSVAKFRYVHIGHLHKNMIQETWRRTIKDEYLGTEVEICPSLAPTDNWHFDNMYTGNQRRSKSFLYSKTGGKVAEWYYAI